MTWPIEVVPVTDECLDLYRAEIDRLREANANLAQALARATERIIVLEDLLDDDDLIAEAMSAASCDKR
jgi:hypothetical protein